MEDLSGHVTDDELAVEPFRAQGWEVEFVPWDADEDWSRFAGVLIRSTWDYYKRLDAFLESLARIDAQTRLANPIEIVRWNARKTYLADLERRGVPIVPTVFGSGLTSEVIAESFDRLGAGELIIKPVVSAGAYRTFRLLAGGRSEERRIAASSLSGEAYMAQPFIESVLEEGEYSVFYFGGQLSHTAVKTPKAADFRVQEEHGGTIRRTTPPDGLEEAARKAAAAVEPQPLYTRVDLVRGASGEWLVMEIELIEPSLYLRTDPDAAGRLATAFDRWMHVVD